MKRSLCEDEKKIIFSCIRDASFFPLMIGPPPFHAMQTNTYTRFFFPKLNYINNAPLD